ncbi:hypothetical protein UFOVP355_46 [uncultured Caudovirales phage]|uniref:Uncharacterized protein n=1 Tax=uncultured Caudovirales phage TaxID=2100421 RepID=A0A6J5NJ60_9CAUD|nr:hypothetical protein UFOVP355_46 [uncultured Caudovirales phage]CAB4156938.1 hypothetical protein UFOVP677_46 [uncultured Caudovirales phage]
MAFRMNPVTNKWEQVPAQGKGQPTPSPATAKTTTVNLPQVSRVASTTAPQRIAPIVRPRPTTSTTPRPATGGAPIGPQPSQIGSVPIAPQQQDPQAGINAMWNALYDEAAAYKQINFGEDPPAGWWSARMAPIEAAQKRVDASGKTKGDGGASDRAKAAKAEAERIRKVKGGREGEAFLREQAKTRKEEMLKRVAELYDPLKTKSAEDLKTVLQSASDAFDLAETQVGEAQTNFQQQFKPSTAYEGVPISTFNVADNPLLAALQQQGAGTGEVKAETDYARQMAQSTSDLEKWALGQLNVGQQNYGSAVQNAAQMGTMAALQQLGGRRADVKTGIQQQFADALAELAKQEVGAKGDVDTVIAGIISEADKMRADTTADYGNLPSEIKKPEEIKPKAETTPKAPVVNKPKAPVVKKTPQQVESERLAAMAKQYRK